MTNFSLVRMVLVILIKAGVPGSEQERRGRRNDREKVSRKSNQGLATMLSIPAPQEKRVNTTKDR